MRYTQRSTSVHTRKHAASQSITVQDAVSAYLLHHESTNSQPATKEWHHHCLGSFVTYCTKDDIALLVDVTTEDAQRWVVTLQSIPGRSGGSVSGRTISWYVRSLRAFYRWSCRRGFIEIDITEWLDLPKVIKPIIRILEPEEFKKLLDACQPYMANNVSTSPHLVARNEAILWLLYDTGIRLAELCNLKLADIDRNRGTIIVFGKGRKERKIALGKNALQVMGRYLTHWRNEFAVADSSNCIFLTEQGAFTKSGIQMLFKRLRVRAGFSERRVHPHLFRHTFAVRYLLAGGDVFTLQELLGHEDMETIRNYMHLADANVQSQKRKFSPGDQIEFTQNKKNRSGFRAVIE